MRAFLLTTTLMALACRPLGAQVPQQDVKAEDAIRKTIDAYAAAWNSKDAAGITNLYTSDADYTGFGSTMTRGRANLERMYFGLFAAEYAGTHLTIAVSSMRFLKPDVAVVDGTLELRQR